MEPIEDEDTGTDVGAWTFGGSPLLWILVVLAILFLLGIKVRVG